VEWTELVFTCLPWRSNRDTNISNHDLSFHLLFNRVMRSSGLPINAEPLIKQTQEGVRTWSLFAAPFEICLTTESFLIHIVFFVSNTIVPSQPCNVESEDSSILA
jgi:hypothetical protein